MGKTNVKEVLKEADALGCWISVPIDDIGSIDDLKQFIKTIPQDKYEIVLKYETSNFHQGVLVSVIAR